VTSAIRFVQSHKLSATRKAGLGTTADLDVLITNAVAKNIERPSSSSW